MGLSSEQYATPDPLLSPGAKDFLEGFAVGRWSVARGRAARLFLRKARNPVQRRIWSGQFFFPLRNLILRNRPIAVALGDHAIQLIPQGSAALDNWSGLRHKGNEVSFVLNLLDPRMAVFDVGANAGLFAVSAAKTVGENGVFAFEPCSATCDILKRNLQLNGVPGVHTAQIALGDTEGEAVLQINARGKDGLNTLGHASHPDSEVVGQEKVSITTLDEFIKQRGIPRVDVIKADIEGAELMLFRGAKDLLRRADAPLILYESFGFLTRGFGYHPVEILWLLESSGYELFTLDGATGAISELKPDYGYDSMVIAAKPGHASYAKVRARVQ